MAGAVAEPTRRSPVVTVRSSALMLDLLAFDLDGTLADTESLKALSYGWAAHRLRPDIDPDDVREAYERYVGRSREEIAQGLLDQFELADAARQHDAAVEPWESFVGLRLERYRAMLADADRVRANARPASLLVPKAHRWARSVALVTTTDRQNADLVLGALGLADAFDAIVTADDVAVTKPDPEAYRLALDRLGADVGRSLAVEDSRAGALGAVHAGLRVLVAPDRVTSEGVHGLVEAGTLPTADVLDPSGLEDAIRRASDEG